ncbi:hypothetical protein GF1_26020 [Desulfolithobacter dissulfuricans]|uniref:Uncharacterized protein n=2 Tax=Desulfolithobacter dissulfuricans TaxID=2795293 RepID=A0A915XLP5_9BACT|nr:hypothetical protein GF1_26020 [Desulfolithobacter dissulfuricans]
MQAFLNGDNSFNSSLDTLERKINSTFSTFEQVDWSEKKFLHDDANYKNAKALWHTATMKHFLDTSDKNFNLHTTIIEELIYLIKNISNRLGIPKDRNIQNHYLSVALFDTLPKLKNHIGMIRGFTTGILTKQQISKEDKKLFLKIYLLANAELNTLQLSMHHYLKQTNIPKLERSILQSSKTIELFMQRTESLVLHTDSLAQPVKSFFKEATQTIGEISKLHDDILNHFQNDLKNRMDAAESKIILVALGLTSMVLFAGLLGLAFYQSVSRPLQELQNGVYAITHGNYSPLKVDTKDELATIALAFNTMAAEIRKQLSFLQWYKTALDSSSLVSKTDPEGNITYVNELLLHATGYSEKELIGKRYKTLLHPEMPEELFRQMREAIRDKKIWNGELKTRTKNGTELITETTIIPILDDKNQIKEYVAVHSDITELIKSKEKIQNMLYFDTLTGLPNRARLLEDLKKEKGYAIIIVNIDDFRLVNDFYGYEAGNKMLQDMALWISNFAQGHYAVYRLPSDEFALVSFESREARKVIDFARAMTEYIEKHTISYNGSDIPILIKAGVALLRDDKDVGRILINADTAIKEAKQHLEKIIFYNESRFAKEAYKRNMEWIKKIKTAIAEDRIVPFFQPIYNNRTNKIDKYEALVRLIDTDGSVISPFHFLDIAKKAKLYTDITRIMIEKSFQVFARRNEELSVNISTQDILDADLVAFLIEKIKGYKMQNRINCECSDTDQATLNNRIVFELTESEEVENYDETIRFIKKIKECGGKMAIDDFGTGYSNFVYILNMGINYLKIDGSLIKTILTDDKSLTLVKAIVGFTRELGIKTIAEFVSDAELQKKVEEIGIDYSQGYYIDKPLPQEKLPPPIGS